MCVQKFTTNNVKLDNVNKQCNNHEDLSDTKQQHFACQWKTFNWLAKGKAF